jgi:Pentapeptide repeats (8 copies)
MDLARRHDQGVREQGSAGKARLMATAPWWWVPLMTVIGAPLLGALLYFLVPLLTAAKRLGIWLSDPPWWVQNIFAALLVGGIVAAVSIWYQERSSDKQATQATRLENLRFVRQLSSGKDVVARPFSGLDLQGQNLGLLDLRGADLIDAQLTDADLVGSNLASTPTRPTFLAGAKLTRADLSSADLTGAVLWNADLEDAKMERANLTDAILGGTDLKGADLHDAILTRVHYDEKTVWPVGFKPPPSAPCPYQDASECRG